MKKTTKVRLLWYVCDALFLVADVLRAPARPFDWLGMKVKRKAHKLQWGEDPEW